MKELKVYQMIARNLERLASDNLATHAHADDKLDYLAKERLPSGSGVDAGCKIDRKSTAKRIVITFGFHHMDEHGSYDGWTDHTAVITPDFLWKFKLRITGRDRNGIKEYLYDLFDDALSATYNGND